MKGKWSKGIQPRNFVWIVKDQIAVCERPGGHTLNHRRVRRHEEVIWIRENGFGRVISLLASPHNLHAYEELQVAYDHVPFGIHEDVRTVLSALYPQMRSLLSSGNKILLHQDEISDRLQGVVGGYLLYEGMLKDGPQAVTVIETIMGRHLGPIGREIVNTAAEGV